MPPLDQLADFQEKLAALEQENRDAYYQAIAEEATKFRFDAAGYLLASSRRKNQASDDQMAARNELIKSQVSELVYTLLVSDIGCFVMLFNLSVVIREDCKALIHVRLGGVRSAIACKELHESHSYIVFFLKMPARRNFNDYA